MRVKSRKCSNIGAIRSISSLTDIASKFFNDSCSYYDYNDETRG